MYENIRKFAIYFFIFCMVAVAIVVIFAIWGLFAKDIIGKSFATLAILLVSAALVGITTLIREGKAKFSSTPSAVAQVPGSVPAPQPDISVGRVILYVVLVLIALPFIFGVINGLMH